jgi:hypothetical protein
MHLYRLLAQKPCTQKLLTLAVWIQDEKEDNKTLVSSPLTRGRCVSGGGLA